MCIRDRKYDIVTIAAVNNDVAMLKLALAGGTDPKAITSPYNGTALIAAAHLGHAEVVRVLIAAGAPLDHVNNLGLSLIHISEPTRLLSISYAVFCLKKKTQDQIVTSISWC